MVRWVLSLACVALLARPVGAQEAERLERLGRALPDSAMVMVQLEIERARKAALPLTPILQKALEGVAKEAPASLIVQAVRGLRARMETVREVLGPDASEPEMISGAIFVFVSSML